MATDRGTIDFLLEQTSRAGRMSARRMFGEYALYCDGKVVALVCDDRLFIKPTAAGRALMAAPVEGLPYRGAKPWLLVSGDLWDDADWLAALTRATAYALPPSKPKPVRARKQRG
jgi:TfoX/Sxy family transcriptional regulator of competence genes